MNGGAGGTFALGTDRIALTVDPGFGARVISLTDRASDRQWLLRGPRAADVSQAAAYRGAASRGWDECFPTLLPCDHGIWGGRLRDYGMLWGRAWQVTDAGPQILAAQFSAEGITFARKLTLAGVGLVVDYALTSDRDVALPWLWSQHCVLAVTPDDRIALTGQGRMVAEGVGL